jgi:hypothetical protein
MKHLVTEKDKRFSILLQFSFYVLKIKKKIENNLRLLKCANNTELDGAFTLGSKNWENLPKMVRRKGATLLLVKNCSKGLMQQTCHEMLMFPLQIAGQIIHPSNDVLTVCVYV